MNFWGSNTSGFPQKKKVKKLAKKGRKRKISEDMPKQAKIAAKHTPNYN
jgi:hypothetical protein